MDSLCKGIDTLGALGQVTISGHVERDIGGLFDNFNGELYATIYDKSENITTLDTTIEGKTILIVLN
jgi:hypothetical protein